MTVKLCEYNKFGHCKYGGKCSFRHNNEKCDKNDCNVTECEKRHPKICIFIRKFGRCKFTSYCSFDHKEPKDIIKNNEKIAELETKVKNLEKTQTGKDSLESSKQIEKRVEAYENKFAILVQIIEEKDTVINSLKKKTSEIEGKFISLENNFKLQKENIEVLSEKIIKLETNDIEHVKCNLCEFSTTSKKGMKTHIKRKHSVANKDQVPVSCQLCDVVLESKREMKAHKKCHTYISQNEEETEFKCAECDFIGQCEWTMQIHFSKNHNKGNIECGLCDFEAKDLECLEMHLTTCEIYECANCVKSFKTLSEIRKHMIDEENLDECGLGNIFHVKIDRKNSNEASYKEYTQNELY